MIHWSRSHGKCLLCSVSFAGGITAHLTVCISRARSLGSINFISSSWESYFLQTLGLGKLSFLDKFHSRRLVMTSRRVDEEHLTKVLRNAISRFVLSYAVCRLVTIVVTSGFVGAERGHLMVWAVFAPKFAFDELANYSEMHGSFLVYSYVSDIYVLNKA